MSQENKYAIIQIDQEDEQTSSSSDEFESIDDDIEDYVSIDFIEDEPVLALNRERLLIYPIQYPEIWGYYQEARRYFWTPDKFNFSLDMNDWRQSFGTLRPHIILHILAHFIMSDQICNENVVAKICDEVQIPEARCFIGFQITMEKIHWETYALLMNKYLDDPMEQKNFFNMIRKSSYAKAKNNWMLKWNVNSMSFAQRLVALVAIKGIFFSGIFAVILWMGRTGSMSNFTSSMASIYSDNCLHRDFASNLFKLLKHRPDDIFIHRIITDAVDVEMEFFLETLDVGLVGLDSADIEKYIQYAGDKCLESLNVSKYYDSDNPFHFVVAD